MPRHFESVHALSPGSQRGPGIPRHRRRLLPLVHFLGTWKGGNVGETQKQEYGVRSRERERNAQMEITIDREGGKMVCSFELWKAACRYGGQSFIHLRHATRSEPWIGLDGLGEMQLIPEGRSSPVCRYSKPLLLLK